MRRTRWVPVVFYCPGAKEKEQALALLHGIDSPEVLALGASVQGRTDLYHLPRLLDSGLRMRLPEGMTLPNPKFRQKVPLNSGLPQSGPRPGGQQKFGSSPN